MHIDQNPCVLQPDFSLALQVEEALRILQCGDERLSQSDRYLSEIRSSPAAWPACCALIRSKHSSQPSLIFAARTLHTRIIADWPKFTDDSQRISVFNLALEGLNRNISVRPPASSSSTVHFFGRACGFCLGMACTPESRSFVWRLLVSGLRDHPVMRCTVLAAVALEVESIAKRDTDKYMAAHTFCKLNAPEVLSSAMSVLSILNLPAARSSTSVEGLKAAISCVQAWQGYTDKTTVLPVLLKAIQVPQIADDVAETLVEVVGYSNTSDHLLLDTCDGLIASFHAVQGSSAEGIVHHAIAEVTCALSEGNADEILERDDKRGSLIGKKATELLWLCTKSCDDNSFYAAVEGWSSWVTAAHSSTQCYITASQVAALVSTVVERMSVLDFVTFLVDYGEEDALDFIQEMTAVADLLLEAGELLGVAPYLRAFTRTREDLCNCSPEVFCANMSANAVAGEDLDLGGLNAVDKEFVLDFLRDILWVVESSWKGSEREGKLHRAAKRAALDTLSSYATFLADSGSDNDYSRALQCWGRCLMDKDVSEKAAKFFFEMANGNPRRGGLFLEELLSSIRGAIPQLSDIAAVYCVRGVSCIVSQVGPVQRRIMSTSLIIENACESLKRVCAQKNAGHDTMSAQLGRALRLISASMQELNDNEAAMSLFEPIHSSIIKLAGENSANSKISESLCRLLIVCASPTQFDDLLSQSGQTFRSHPEKHMEERRIILASSFMELAGECFLHSGKSGDAVWVQTLYAISSFILDGLESGLDSNVVDRAVSCLGGSLKNCLTGLQAFSEGNYDTQHAMSISYFRFATRLLGCIWGINVSLQCVQECTATALNALRCDNAGIVRMALLWWKEVFVVSIGSDSNMASAVLTASGGADNISKEISRTGRHTRCAGIAADVLFAMCRWLGGLRAVEPRVVMQACLTVAFSGDDLAHIDGGVREGAYQQCLNAARNIGSFRAVFRQVAQLWTQVL